MDYAQWLDELSKRTGASVEQSDLTRLGETNEDDRSRLMSAYESQYAERGRSGQEGSGTDSAERSRQGYGSARSETADDGGANRQSVAQQWNNLPGAGMGGMAAGGAGGGLFPDWYRELLTRQQSQQEAQAAENKSRADSLYAQITDRAKQSTVVDRNNPVIRAQADAYAANEERARRNDLSDVAERSGPLANIRGEQRMLAERTGQRTGAFEAELMGRELTAIRNEKADAYRMAAGMLNADQQRQAQAELAWLDQAIAEAGIGLGARGQDLNYSLGARGQDIGYDSFLRDLALREFDTNNRWDYSWTHL